MDIAIVGGGPAGAYCAFELAKKGVNATIFDHSHPREKPCGGGISSVALEKFPFLEKLRVRGCSFGEFKVITCTNREVVTEGQDKGFSISRQLLDQELLEMATRSGADMVREKVVRVRRDKKNWIIDTTQKSYNTKTLVGADGVSSIVRRATVGPISKDNLGLTFGYYVTGVKEKQTIVKYLEEMPGYIWVFRRKDEASIGIGSELRFGSLLRRTLDEFMRTYCPNAKVISKFAVLLPSASDPDFFNLPCAGADWVLVGDAAGHVDPITGEGIHYALWSAKLAAHALAQKELEPYDALWRKEYGCYLMERCRQKENFYNPLSIEMSIMARRIDNKTNP